MARRLGFVINAFRSVPAARETSYFPQISVEIRVHYPPCTTYSDIADALTEAFLKAGVRLFEMKNPPDRG